ncbi:MAG TPA: zinc ribbon domain-containing protein [Ignavibacteriaceae bacterium]|nr:zinc ribbon domain-containing protein [Ignavibacteriaceae bacterium]
MPIFEYRCSECNSKFEILHKSMNHTEEVNCPVCNSVEIKKLLSSFSASVPASASYSFGGGCSDGSCAVNTPSPCSSGMCGLN